MRGQICDQDLTDYALNELQAEERLYVESMLAVSEECRHDVYQMIELGLMLDEGFEAQEERMPAMLTGSQREKLLQFRNPFPAWQKAAGVLGAAACAAFAFTHPGFWKVSDPAGQMARVSTHVSQMVADAVTQDMMSNNFAEPLANLRAFAEDTSHWLPAEMRAQPMVCTPPSLLESFETASLSTFSDVTQ